MSEPSVHWLMKRALYYTKTNISLKSFRSMDYQNSDSQVDPSIFPLIFFHFLSCHQLCLSTFLSFHKRSLCTHVPIRQGRVTTGQSEQADNEDDEGPGHRSEITGHTVNESLNRESKLTERLETVPSSEMLEWLVVSVVMLWILQTHSTDEKDRRGKKKMGGCLKMPMPW